MKKTKKASKTTSKIKELKGIKPENISAEHLEKLQNTVSSVNQAQMSLGVMEVRKHRLLHEVAAVQDQLTLLQSEFEKEYGTYDIDIQTGKINHKDE